MTTTTKSGNAVVRGLLPDDLSLYLGKKTLVKLFLETVQRVNGESVAYEGFALDGTQFRKPMMLTLLAYCYATGVYASGEIEQKIERDSMTRYLCAKTYPSSDDIRAFRRYQRAEIRQCLADVFRRAWKLRFSGEEDGGIAEEGSHSKLSIQRWIESPSSPDFEVEAEARLVRAIRADSMALDI